MLKFSLALPFILLAIAAPQYSQATDGDRWLDRKSEGFFWYKDDEEEEDEFEENTKPPKRQAPKPHEEPTQAEAKPVKPSGPAPMSSAWLRENIQKYLDAAIDNPSPENVAAFLYLQQHAMNKSFQFMDATTEYSIGHAQLDEIHRRPAATFGNQAVDKVVLQEKSKLMDLISQRAGLFVFFDNSYLSERQLGVIDGLQNHKRISVVKIATEQLNKNFAGHQFKLDKGLAETLSIKHFPAIVLMAPSGEYSVISQSAVSIPEIESRVFVGAKRLGLISDEEFNNTRPVKNLVKPGTLAESQSNNELPIPASSIIKFMEGQK